MVKKYNKVSPELKAKVAIEALKEAVPCPQLAQEYKIHPRSIFAWCDQLRAQAVTLFQPKGSKKCALAEADKEELLKKIGELTMENAYLKKKLEK